MAKCVFKIGDKEFKNIKEVQEYIAASNSNDVAPDQVTQSEVLDMIRKTGESIQFIGERQMDDGTVEDAHDYEYKGRKLKPVSIVIDEEYRYRGGQPGPKGIKAKEVGTEFHKVAENTINALNEGKSKEMILKSLPEGSYRKWAEQVFGLYETWSDGGKNKILTEFRIANTKQGVAGTVDVAVVYPDGSLEIYDFKGTSSTYLSSEESGVFKRRANNYQLNLYKRMLEIGDEQLGMKKLVVRGAAIIPVELNINVDENQVASLTSFTQMGPYKFNDDHIFTDHVVNQSLAKLRFPVSGEGENFGKLKTSQIPDWMGFINTHTGINFETISYNLGAVRVANHAQWDAEKGVHWTQIGKEKYYFKDPIAKTDRGEAGRKARIQEIERGQRDNLQDNYYSPAEDLAFYINNRRAKSIDTDNVQNPMVSQLHMMSRMYRTPVDKAIKANSLPGLSTVGDDVILVYKGFNPDSGKYSSIDIITVNNDSTGEIHVKQEKGSTILGKYASNSQAKIIAQQAGAAGVKVYDNTRRNAHLLKMGLIAAHLQNDNPGIVVDRLSVGTLGGKEFDAIGVPVAEVMQQLSILAAVKKEGKSVLDLSYGRDTKISEMLRTKELLDPKKYQGRGLEAYLRFAGISSVYDRSGSGDKYDQVQRLRNWIEFKDHKELLKGIYTESGIKATMDAVDQNEEMKQLMLEALIKRQRDIEKILGKDGDEAYINDLEYGYVSRAIMDLSGLTDQHSTFKSLNYVTRKLITPGMTGIEIVDEFIGRMQRTIADMNRRMYKEFFTKSIDMHKKLVGEMSGTGKIAKHQAGDMYLPLMEHIEVPVEGDLNKKIRRPTGRFWAEDSAEYKALSTTQKEYIKWFQETTYEAMTQGMTKEKKEHFDQYWDKNMIPHLNPSLDTRLGDMFGAENSEGKWLDKVQNYSRRFLDPYASKNDYVESLTDDYTHMIDKLENQKSFRGAPVDRFGDVDRMNRLGFTADGLAKTSYIRPGDPEQKEIPITRTMETNLETVLAYVVANKYRQESLSHLVPEFKAVKGIIASANSTRFYKNDLLLKYLKEYVEKNLFQKNQITEEQEGLAKVAMAGKMVANFMLLDYNIVSQLKNTIAGFYHVVSTSIANPKLGKHVPKAYAFVSNPANVGLVNSLMWTYGMSSSDTDQLVNGYHTQIGKRGAASSHYKNIINYGADYYHRSVFMVAQMMDDGLMNAFVENDNVDGAWYDYDEDKDPRWREDSSMNEEEKKKRRALKEFVKTQLAKEGKLSPEGKMLSPYTSYELQNMKRTANEAFEAQNNEDQENFRNGIEGLLFGQFKSWWLQKVKRYAAKGHVSNSAKQLKMTAVTGPNGDTEYTYSYEGPYMEGIFYTLVGMGNALKASYDLKSFASWNEYMESLSPQQRENIRRILGDFSLLAGAIALGAFMFDDEDQDSVWYYLWFQSANEINVWSYLSATPIVGTGSAIPSMGVASKFLQNPLKTITEPGFTRVFDFFAESK